MIIIGLSGKAGAGKSTVAGMLVTAHCFEEVSLATPMKDFCREVLGFSFEQLYGPSEFRNKVDPRYGKSTREALQTLGTEWGRAFHEDMWINYALRKGNLSVRNIRCSGIVISDVRFLNERDAIHKAGGKVWRIVHPGAGLSGAAAAHASETELTDKDCDRVIDNEDGPMERLSEMVAKAVSGR